MTALSRLGLGTVQFGLDYGVSNQNGRPDEKEVAAILACAIESQVGYIDTAPTYGDAELLVGRHLPIGHNFQIVTKTPPVAEATIEARHAELLVESVAASLARLKVDSVYGLLVHQGSDLAKPGWEHIVDALAEVRARGWVNRIGASIYDADQLALVESRFAPQLVQLPLNAIDRRPIVSGTLARLRANGAEIHARSVFLQGMLLMEPNDLPDFFAPIRKNIANLHDHWRQRGLSALEGCLSFVMQRPEVDAIIVGVNRGLEFEQIEAAVASCGSAGMDLEIDQPIDSMFVDPSQWPVFTH